MSDAQLTARSLELLLGTWRTSAASYAALADRIRLLVLDGRVPIGTRLPAERDLAGRLQLSRTTVAAAYRQLREGGFVDSVRGSGSVTRLPGRTLPLPATGGEGMLDFTKASLPAASPLAAAARAAAEELPRFLPDPGYDPVGLPHLRAEIAERYTRRGLPTDPGQILVTVGAQQAIALIARTFLQRGDRVVIEVPTYPHAIEAMRLAGARLVPITVTAPEEGPHRLGEETDGWDAEGIEQTFRRANPALAYLIPDFHNPTGASMSPETRRRVLAAAAGHGTIVVADETTAELDIDRVGEYLPLPSYADPATPAAPIVMIGSASKTLWGGLRIGWIRAERSHIQRLIAAKPATDLGTPVIEQLVVAQLLPQLAEIAEERREQLRLGRAEVHRLVAETFPEWTVPPQHGGLTAWVGIGAPVSSALALAARSHGLLIAAGPRFGLDGAFERFLRIPITYTPEEYDRAFTALSRAWAVAASEPAPYFDQGALPSVV
ncbi:PLP-dependent aminotransferase family protein [Leifsonia shinshuensis]|uniref:MocR-like transcription factor YczR n=1 Tax=Leifsonia shinshuensis TaxID=150026 RepID=UPI00285791CC|nr:PLP-dependent aminotransferase family protein [Leifsonia shinshuensis]MDR6971822.1 DNA-binding transcriptional MocR family regulator [Leifsonia shinshuensis]